jgi:hypothetical protein
VIGSIRDRACAWARSSTPPSRLREPAIAALPQGETGAAFDPRCVTALGRVPHSEPAAAGRAAA